MDVDGKGLGRLEAVSDIRSVWAHEASDFTPWLFENLDLLSDAIGLPLSGEAMEHPVGPYRLDILARDPSDRAVAIENQVEPADHSHLGQMVLYAAHVNAATAIWISPRFRDEQRQSLIWLNENTVEGVRFFAVELGVVKIGDSPPAPVFNVVVRPNDLQKADPSTATTAQQSPAIVARREFLDRVMARMVAALPGFRPPSGLSWQSYMWFRGGPFGYFAVTFTKDRRLRAEVYLDLMDAALTKALFDELQEKRAVWEQKLGFSLEWERNDQARSSRLATYRDYWIPDDGQGDAEAAERWAADSALRLIEVLEPTLRSRAAALRAG